MGGGVWSCEFGGQLTFACFSGAVLGSFCRFLRILADFEDFWASFFLFSLFSTFSRRYTRTEEVRLMYSPSKVHCQAGQLGPRGYRIWKVCPACGFALKPLVSLAPIVVEYSRNCSPYSPDSGYSWVVLTVEMGSRSRKQA
jgi:hypothetical protein